MGTKNMFILLVIAFQVSSCWKDNCDRFGDTFISINIDKVEKDASGNLIIEFATNTMNDLPASYFEQLVLRNTSTDSSTGEGMKVTESVEATKTTIRLVVRSAFVPGPGEVFTYAPVLNFPDREGYVDCSHPGKSDDYLLYLEMNIQTIDGSEYELNDFVWHEAVHKGAF
ncbi:hypothetical protein SAMN05421766_103531 [Zobellia uliginosa]|uniref:DUF4843 domain-containing protein n=1 Tax=Zobellia uliginosa TaxID=143224 RepID=A0ABY1KW55_9FLAO|nr:hypothetical protein [Zobellia uliginosa]SIS70988.1 hypothetical protein SAMN05421766_103531 [Zobellia uliginosa]